MSRRDASVVIKVWGQLRSNFKGVYRNSMTYCLRRSFSEKVVCYFRQSFFGRMTDPSGPGPAVFTVLESSRIARYFISFSKRCKHRAIYYLEDIPAFAVMPARAGMVIIAAVAVNTVLSLIFQVQIGIWHWLMRTLFLVAGIACLF